jgi:hypothetical protein
VATDPRCSVTLAELGRDHTIHDLLDYVEMLMWKDERLPE